VACIASGATGGSGVGVGLVGGAIAGEGQFAGAGMATTEEDGVAGPDVPPHEARSNVTQSMAGESRRAFSPSLSSEIDVGRRSERPDLQNFPVSTLCVG
jgi:hypothetical protein